MDYNGSATSGSYNPNPNPNPHPLTLIGAKNGIFFSRQALFFTPSSITFIEYHLPKSLPCRSVISMSFSTDEIRTTDTMRGTLFRVSRYPW